ncbi:MAG: DUF4433 domain-containing protein, partial [Gammaproteobacteria bacterium]|nr:DUF4433 domain-containing protein [Gammaproteobacteria bacterium]
MYYLTPLSNLKSIFSDGGIKCRNKMPHTAKDLSSHNIQKRRKDVTITLARKAP